MIHWEPDKYPKVKRDSQRIREYRSEWGLAKTFPEDPVENGELVIYLRTITHDQWFIDHFGAVTFSICFSKRRTTQASCKRRWPDGRDNPPRYSLHFPDNDKNSALLAVHELCHVLCYDQDHGPIYCSILLQLIIHYMGILVGKELHRQFNLHRVKLVR